ncbi:MAG: methylated-DNA--[protein]-cysteine S-methyltransferase [Gammaproteobacteria bacterium]
MPEDEMKTFFSLLPSPIGELLLTSDGLALTRLYMDTERQSSRPQEGWVRDDARFKSAREQLAAYFGGELTGFDLPLAGEGTAFQKRVWKALCDIPYGDTISYGEQARRIGQPNGARAVGTANGQNPISIIVPCHRVIGANGALTGYGGGLPRKKWLLEHEAAQRKFALS